MPASSRHTTAADTTEAVERLLSALVHPMKAEIGLIRSAILEADPGIREGVKWNAPSFRTHEYFATTHLRDKAGIGVILHRGAKVRAPDPGECQVDDPHGLLKWLAADRASVSFADAADLAAKRTAFVALIRAWIRQV